MHVSSLNSRRGLVFAAALLGGVYAAGCSCETPRVPLVDGGPPVERDAFRPDAPQGDSGPNLPVACAPVLEEDIFTIARDEETSPPPVISFARGASEFVVVWAETSARTADARRLMFTRIPTEGSPAPPASLGDQTDGGMAPDVVAVSSGYLVAWHRGAGPEVVVQAFDTMMAATGAPIVISTGSATLPRLAAVTGGAVVAWVSGTTIFARRVDGSGNPAAAVETLADTGVPPSRISISDLGAVGGLVVAWSPPTDAEQRVRLRGVAATGAPAGTTIELGTDPDSAGSIDVAGLSASGEPGVEPLQGAAVFDADQLGFRDVRLRLLGADGTPVFAEASITESGRSSWSPSVVQFGDGYMIGHRAFIPDAMGGTLIDPVIRLAYLDRNGCRVGRTTTQHTITTMLSDVGGPLAIDRIDEHVLVGWTEIIFDGGGTPDVTDYRVARVECR